MVAKEVVVGPMMPARALGVLERHGVVKRERNARRNNVLIRAFAHEIRSPLTAIRAYSSVALQPEIELTGSLITELMQGIESSARMVEVIIEDLETLSEHQTIRLQPTVLDLSDFLPDLAPELVARAPKRQLELVFHVPRLRLRTDPVRLQQVLTNLVANAHKHSKADGSIVIEVARTKEDVIIAVEDEGPGVPAEDLERIFEPFYRSMGSSEVRGSGLGLAICKGLVEAQGGQLEASLLPHGGFRLLMTLPTAA